VPTSGDGSLGRTGPYQLDAVIGRGGSGTVYRARSPEGTLVAVKVLHVAASAGTDAAEIDVLAGLQHPGVVRILDHGALDGRRFIATELLDGPTLRAMLRPPAAAIVTVDFDDPNGAVAPTGMDPLARQALGQLAHTLAWLHGEGVVHRDLKPENVVWVGDRAVLLDFGLATTVEARESVDRLRGGTPGYMPREQARGEVVDARSDLYAFGCMLVEAGADAEPALDELLPGLLADQPERRTTDLLAVANGLGVPSFGPKPRLALHRPPLVGRDDEMRSFDERLANGGPLLVTAPSGAGRTRFVVDAAARARRLATTFVTNRRGPLAPFARLIRAACALPEAPDPAEGAALAAVAAELGIATPWPSPGPLEREPHRARSLAGLAVAWRRVAASRPVVCAIDDLHAADPLTLEATLRLAGRVAAGDLRGVLLATWDTDAGDPPPEVTRAFGAPVPLRPLTAAELDAICLAAAPTARSVTREAARRLAEGSPLLCMDGLRFPAGGTLAETYEERASIRLGALPDAARAVVEAVTVGGDEVALDGLCAAAGLTGRDASVAVHVARREGFIEVDEGWARVPHRRLADVVRSGIGPQRARALHRGLAERCDGNPRAHHLWRADDGEAACAVWAQVARAHPDPSERHAALDALERAGRPLPDDLAIAHATLVRDRGDRGRAASLALNLRPSSDHDRVAAWLLAASCLPRTDPTTLTCLQQAAQVADASGDAALAVEVGLARVQRQRHLAAPLPTLIEELDGLRARIRPDDLAQRVREAHARGAALLVFGQAASAAAALTDVLPAIDAVDPATQCAVFGNLGAARWQALDLDGAVHATIANLRAAARHGLLGSLRVAMGNLALALHGMDDVERADLLFGGALSLEVDDDDGLVGVLIRVADVYAASARPQPARALLDDLAAVATAGHAHEIALRRARLLVLDGRLDDALAAVTDVPEGLRDDPREIKDLVACLRGADRLPQSTEACLVLGLTAARATHRDHARDRFVQAFGALPTALHRRWAVHFGADPSALPAPPPAPDLPPEVDALGRPLAPALARALARLRRRAQGA
jgi:hypothetical protein